MAGGPQSRTSQGTGRPPSARRGWLDYEVETVAGLEEFAEREMATRLAGSVTVVGAAGSGRISIKHRGDARLLNGLRTAVAVHALLTLDVPRPTALLGHEKLGSLLRFLEGVVARHAPGTFGTFRLSAAGAESPAFTRVKKEIGRALGLAPVEQQPHLLVAIRRPPDGSPGWQVLARTTPRPLSARDWRVCDMPGALNATVASAMVGLANPSPAERFLNVACGSGTLLVERLGLGPARLAVGNDLSERALICARANLRAAGHDREVQLLRSDAANLPLRDASVDTVVVDLPFGMLMGQREENERLYPTLLAEAGRVAVPAATMVAITASRRLFEGALERHRELWRCLRTIPLRIPYQSGYITPSIYLLRRR